MLYEILKDFDGSQDGRFTKSFKAGTQEVLSDYLAAIAVPAGLAKLAHQNNEIPAQEIAAATDKAKPGRKPK